MNIYLTCLICGELAQIDKVHGSGCPGGDGPGNGQYCGTSACPAGKKIDKRGNIW